VTDKPQNKRAQKAYFAEARRIVNRIDPLDPIEARHVDRDDGPVLVDKATQSLADVSATAVRNQHDAGLRGGLNCRPCEVDKLDDPWCITDYLLCRQNTLLYEPTHDCIAHAESFCHLLERQPIRALVIAR
jgi:hypothetical protein